MYFLVPVLTLAHGQMGASGPTDQHVDEFVRCNLSTQHEPLSGETCYTYILPNHDITIMQFI